MQRLRTSLVLLALTALLAPSSDAQTSSWRYYRIGNTGIQGDFNEAIWIDPDDAPWIGGYVPQFEEGGIAKYLRDENRWVNVSNVDHPEFGDPQMSGSARVHDIAEDASGQLWLATWNALVHFDPAVGPDSIVRYGAENSPHPGGRTMDVDVAPDGTVWAAVLYVAWGTGGLIRFDPATDTWTVWDSSTTTGGWPTTANSAERLAVRPKPGGGYEVFVELSGLMLIWDSDTQLFTPIPHSWDPGTLVGLSGRDSVDEAGNLWARVVGPGGATQVPRLEVLRPDGTWFVPPEAGPSGSEVLNAFGDLQALSIDGNHVVSRFDGTSWTSYGAWKSGGFSLYAAIDSQGVIWVCGTGGAARLDPAEGIWERHRITNSSQGTYWVNDIALGENGEVWMNANYGPGTGGMGRFDGERWFCFNNSTHGLGEPWPFPTDNSTALAWRPSIGHLAVVPTFNPIAEWTGTQFVDLPGAFSNAERMVEDSLGRLWAVGEYFSLRFEQDGDWTDVAISGWGANIERDPSTPGGVWACANLEVVRTDGTDRVSWQTTDLPELNPQSDVLTRVAAAPDGTAWVGSIGGLFHLDPFTGTHQHWDVADGLPGERAWPLGVTPDGRVWFSNFDISGQTPDKGLGWFDGEQFGFVPVSPDGLPHEQIVDGEVREIEGGYELWLSCLSRGVAVLTVEYQPSHAAYGCDLNPAGSLEVISEAAIGDSLEVALANPLGTQAPGSLAFLGLSTQGLAAPCGLSIDGSGMAPGEPGELLVSLPLVYLSPPAVWNGVGTTAAISVPIPDNPALLGHQILAQGALIDSVSPSTTVALTQAVVLTFGL